MRWRVFASRARPARALGAILTVALLVTTGAGLAPLAPRPACARPGRHADRALRRAKAHFVRGQAMFAKGRFAAALREYKAAFDAKPLPELLFNIGQCYRNLGRYPEAAKAYRKYLRLKPDARNRAAVEALLARMQADTSKTKPAASAPATHAATEPSHETTATQPAHPVTETHPLVPAPGGATGSPAKRAASPPPRRLPLIPRSGHPGPAASTGSPFYTRWWFWTGVAAVAAGSAAIYVAARPGSGGIPSSDLGNWTFAK